MSGATNQVLVRMLDRLFAALVNGPSLNARPHASRQRVDFAQLSRLGDAGPEEALRRLLGEARQVRLAARVPAPKKRGNGFAKRGAGTPVPAASPKDAEHSKNGNGAGPSGSHVTDIERAAEKAWVEQQALLSKLRVIADDARTYEQDTGVHVLNIGFPLLSLPPGSFDARHAGAGRRVLAPIAFIPVAVTLSGGAVQNVQIACRGDGIDLVVPNNALLAWLEQQTGKPMDPELYAHPTGDNPWREVSELVAHVCNALDLEVPELFRKPEPGQSHDATQVKTDAPTAPPAVPSASADALAPQVVPQVSEQQIEQELAAREAPPPDPKDAMPRAAEPTRGIDALKLQPPPRADEDEDAKARVVPSAVIGLFPMANQGLLRDMQAMVGGEALAGPVRSFIEVGASFFDKQPEPAGPEEAPEPVAQRTRSFTDERLVTGADPFQSRAVRLARESRGLVVHGPPGTGKSQTITNIIGDHLARGQRVLFVCDKRTALDVVYDRLEHMGLGSLCAVIHDPQRDQRELYRAVREQLDALPEAKSDAKADGKLAKVDAELQSIHAELSRYADALMRPPADGAGHGLSLHELVGRWLALAPVEMLVERPAGTPAGARTATVVTVESAAAQAIAPHELDEREGVLRDILTRAAAVDFARNPWARAAGTTLADFMARPMEQVREAMGAISDASREADAAADAAIPPFGAGVDLLEHGRARAELAERIDDVTRRVDPAVRTRWGNAANGPEGAEALRRARQRLAEADPFAQALRAGPPDAELSLAVRDNLPDLSLVARQLAQVAQYLEVATKWWSFLAFGRKKQAAEVVNRHGLTLQPSTAVRVHAFLTALRARLALRDLINDLSGGVGTRAGPGVALPDDAALSKALEQHAAVIELLTHAQDDAALRELAPSVAKALTDGAFGPTFVGGLRKSPARAAALVKLEGSLSEAKLFEAGWLGAVSKKLRSGHAVLTFFTAFSDGLDTLEGVLRVREALVALPPTLHAAAGALVKQSAAPDEGLKVLRREVLAAEITRRLKVEPHLQSVDGRRLSQMFDQYREADARKKDLVRDAVLHHWTEKQKGRLLASTGSRLNGLGADLRRRLTTRGERAMRLRQVVAVGRGTDGGDPLFDLRPVWMASPETVAQVFPREPIFDVVVFDEASQCRLEEALPVLVRGRRVTIAGDPKQLPPTRFFESAVAASDDDLEAETDQQLFEIQQGETEDLLGAALGLDIQQCYLDVHYRSHNADLIEFSNEHFYGSRLQPIPGHPSRRPKLPPVRLVSARGVYEKRQNEIEADKVVELVRELLTRKDPPSIGIACFNLQQRDLIVEKLDELAAQEPSFGRKLAEARVRAGAGSFEGLFVKNLENVQGDERDHMIISTTYGPGPNGRFYRRFGPLGRAGGGRRLNVLVTRAREQVHVVTSIPAEAYRSLPDVPTGQTPGGGWLLFAYLKFAEGLGREYEGLERSAVEEEAKPQAAVNVRPARHPSPVAEALAHKLNEAHGVGADVHWGNEGFCVDVALRGAGEGGPGADVTAGVLCDAARFAQSEDPTEWDAFRTAVLEKQGWKLHRLWTPHFFRDPKGSMKSIAAAAAPAEAVQQARQPV